MPDRVILDVIDRPPGGLPGVVVRARAARAAKPPGMRALLVLGTGRFVPSVVPAPTPRRMALLSAWEDDGDLEQRWTETLRGVCGSAREHWHVARRPSARRSPSPGGDGRPTSPALAPLRSTSPP
jgi:hypothetical protein